MSSSNEFRVNFAYQGANYNLSLVEGKQSDYSVRINGKAYTVQGDKEKLPIACQILNAFSLESVTSQEDLQGKISLGISTKLPSDLKSGEIGKSTILNDTMGVPTTKKLTVPGLNETLAPSVPIGAGANVAILKRGEQPEYIHFGTTRVHEGQLLDKDTAALIGSGAKMFTALLSKILEEQGIIVLEDKPGLAKSKLSDFLDEEHFQIFADPERAKNITLESLLSHTSGLQYHADDSDNSRSGYSFDSILESLIQNVRNDRSRAIKFSHDPEDKIYSYSNQIGLVAICIEKAYNRMLVKSVLETGVPHTYMTYADILKKELLEPLGMNRTGYVRPEDSNILEACVIKEGESPITVEEDFRDPLMQGAGGLWSTPHDMIKLAMAFTLKGTFEDPGGKQLIGKIGVSDLMRVRGINGKTGLALDVEGSVIGKGGSISTYDFKFKIDVSTGNAMVSMCNFSGAERQFNNFVANAMNFLYELNPALSKPKGMDKQSEFGFLELKNQIANASMENCDQFYIGKQGYVGIKKTDFGIIINWNGIKLPAKLNGDSFVVFGGGAHNGKEVIFKEGRGAKRVPYLFIENGIDSIGFQQTTKDKVICSDVIDPLIDLKGIDGIYKSPHPDGPKPISVKISDNLVLFAYGNNDPVPGHVVNIIPDDRGIIIEVWFMTTAEDVPDKMYKLIKNSQGWSLGIALFENPETYLEKPFPRQ